MSKGQWDSLVEHAREAAPEECCGYLTARDGEVEEVFRAENVYESRRYGYMLDSRSMYAAWKLAEEEGREVGIYHSHPRSPAEPSQADINMAQWPGWTYLIVSLEREPDVRAFRIEDGRVEEETLVVE
jgi:[CysO sulfur-carrier protein]-S-L-cysteine hydrolase